MLNHIVEMGQEFDYAKAAQPVLAEVHSDLWILTYVAGFDNGADVERVGRQAQTPAVASDAVLESAGRSVIAGSNGAKQ